jgi:hypothetical protein
MITGIFVKEIAGSLRQFQPIGCVKHVLNTSIVATMDIHKFQVNAGGLQLCLEPVAVAVLPQFAFLMCQLIPLLRPTNRLKLNLQPLR